jgi:DNA-binding response OmpR family regulator
MKQKILVLEDDANLGFILQEHLQLNGFEATLCSNGVEGLAAYRNDRFDLLLVDIMMPKKDGFALVDELRATDQTTPVIFLTAKSLKEDKIKAFKLGCDDYVTKPFSMEELLLRIHAVLRRAASARSVDAPTVFTIGSYEFDSERRLLTIDGKRQKLTTKEAELLKLLCLHINQTLGRDEALAAVWQTQNYFAGRSMDVFLSRLRKHLQGDKKVEIINVHGKGFKLVVR